MSISPTITAGLKKFSGKPLGIVSKVLGVASVASVIYDSHVNAKERAIVTDRMESADRFEKQFNQYTTSERGSATVCKMKKQWYVNCSKTLLS